MEQEKKKKKFSITIPPDINIQLEELEINKSKLITWLLREHFAQLNSVAK